MSRAWPHDFAPRGSQHLSCVPICLGDHGLQGDVEIEEGRSDGRRRGAGTAFSPGRRTVTLALAIGRVGPNW